MGETHTGEPLPQPTIANASATI